ncbi:MAG TPA: HisA/HisF-related TIM barrel protein, partial [Phycisphaerae bacterium]|nr:HisA/HisF-related TIM barrel protein [Phycisphaerae bacterium]
RLVLDLSCRRRGEDYFVVTDRWQNFTELVVNAETLRKLSGSCAEFLIHAVDVEGLCLGIDRELVEKLGRWTPAPATYAGGANSISDLEEVTKLGQGKIDLTIGSALDIFGGHGVRYEDVVKFNRRQQEKSGGGQHRV